jgi:hypothetical protein
VRPLGQLDKRNFCRLMPHTSIALNMIALNITNDRIVLLDCDYKRTHIMNKGFHLRERERSNYFRFLLNLQKTPRLGMLWSKGDMNKVAPCN